MKITKIISHILEYDISEELGDKDGLSKVFRAMGGVYSYPVNSNSNLNIALDYYARSLKISEELGDKAGIGISLDNIGIVHTDKGEYEKALDYYERSLAIKEEIGDKRGMGRSLLSIGHMHWNKGDYEKALEYLEKSLNIQKEIGLGEGSMMLENTTYFYLAYKHLGKVYDVAEIT